MTMDRKNTTKYENVIKKYKKYYQLCIKYKKKVIKIINKCTQDTKNVKRVTGHEECT